MSTVALSPAQQHTLDALLLVGGTRAAAGLSGWLAQQGVNLSASAISIQLVSLVKAGVVSQVPGRGFVVDARQHAERLQTLLLQPATRGAWLRLLHLYSGSEGPSTQLPHWLGLRHVDEAQNAVRLLYFSGQSHAKVHELLAWKLADLKHPSLMVGAFAAPFCPRAMACMDPQLRDEVVVQLLGQLPPTDARRAAVLNYLRSLSSAERKQLNPALQLDLFTHDLLTLDLGAARAALPHFGDGAREVAEAALQCHAGEWAEAARGFEQGLKTLRQLLGMRRGVLSIDMARLYVLSLLAQDQPVAWEQARKFCIAESGSRKPSPAEHWGMWAHVIGARLGEEAWVEASLSPAPSLSLRPELWEQAMDQLILAAWLARGAKAWQAAEAQALLSKIQQSGQHWRATTLAHALQRLELGPAPELAPDLSAPANYLGQASEGWRDALAAICALDDVVAPKAPASALELAWQLELDDEGRVQNVLPFERSQSARGQLKLKPISLLKLKKSGAASPHDAAVLRYIERDPFGTPTALQIDVTQAAMALVGHPAVMLAAGPGNWVELREAQPELEVRKRTDADGSEQFAFHIHPALSPKTPPRLFNWNGNTFETELTKRNSLRVVQDGPQQARLIRISTAQRRVAELVAQGWSVPAGAQAELSKALGVLTGHFQLHSDAAGGQLVAGDSRLRARLTPVGEGLQLQLVAQPFGSFGPAVTPGAGRARLLCMHEGLSLATERDLAAELAHREAVLAALPFLDAEAPRDAAWALNDAQDALRAVELLPQQAGIAGLDWPKGRPLRVAAVASEALSLSVSSGRDWLALSGELHLDEGRVLSLQDLLALARESRSRYVSLGEGAYLALSEQLRQQLRDLDALGHTKKDQLQLPMAAAAWLDQGLSEVQVSGDAPWRRRMDQLATVATQTISAPQGLRAELRGYQLEGYAWMQRLALAGLGACLADDMGLGKTVQTLALLLTRAEVGPALVLAPTSVCANWLAEAATFAPGLQCHLYGEGKERAALLESAGPGSVIIASYALAQIDADLFAAHSWATLVMDEAQALKNAATKRAKSVAEFDAGFRLALSGTPVENRLADLHAIMNLINPGLLGSAAQFNERFATPIEKHQDAPTRQRLRRIVSPFLLRRTKAQVLQDLPARTEIVHLVQPGPEERSFLEALRRDAQISVAEAAAGSGAAPMQVLAQLMRLRRAACDPRLVAPELGLLGAKLAEFERLTRELVDGGHKALVFSQFTDYLALLKERLDSMGVKHQYLDGSTPAPERAKRVAAFQRGEGEVFLISLKAGGFGLNLTMADYVLIVDPWWNPAAEDQAMGRAHRMGQQRPVTVYRLVTAGSVEERIIALHRDKRGLADGILEGQDVATVLDAKALAALLEA